MNIIAYIFTFFLVITDKLRIMAFTANSIRTIRFIIPSNADFTIIRYNFTTIKNIEFALSFATIKLMIW